MTRSRKIVQFAGRGPGLGSLTVINVNPISLSLSLSPCLRSIARCSHAFHFPTCTFSGHGRGERPLRKTKGIKATVQQRNSLLRRISNFVGAGELLLTSLSLAAHLLTYSLFSRPPPPSAPLLAIQRQPNVSSRAAGKLVLSRRYVLFGRKNRRANERMRRRPNRAE